jgi:hypothetical protein
MRAIGSTASAIILTLAFFASRSIEARDKVPGKTTVTMPEQ